MPTLSLDQQRIRSLTPREVEVMELLVLGLNNQEIADRLGCTRKTIENHVTHVMTKADMEGTGRRVLLGIWYDRQKSR